MTDADLRYLESLAGTVKKNLRWAVLLLAAMAVILVIDLQLKRSVAQQAVRSAERCARADSMCGQTEQLITDLKRGLHERIPVAEDSGHPGSGSGDAGHAVVGDTRVAAGGREKAGPASPSPRRRAAGPGKRAAGDGGRASGQDA